MTNKNFALGLEELSLAELDEVVGGANGYIYYARATRQGQNGYLTIKSPNPLTKEQVLKIQANPAANKEFPVAFVSDARAEMYVKRAQARGYELIDTSKM